MNSIIKPEPALEAEGIDLFKTLLKNSQCYLEYGCGGSTVYACNVALVKSVISVDTDEKWIKAVLASVDRKISKVEVVFCDLGEVENWGFPKSEEKVHDFWKYMVSPWEVSKKLDLSPDVILIDGRFRVASFLYSLINAQAGTIILFDDYSLRPHYFVVEEFCGLNQLCGRMGLFWLRTHIL